MFKKSPIIFLLLLLIFLGIFASPARAEAETIEPPVLKTIDGAPATTAIPKTTNRTPTFVGSSNMLFAFMDYEIVNPPITDSGFADRRGVWRWKVPNQLNYGIHTLNVTATNPYDLTDEKTSVFKVEIVKSDLNTIKLGLPKFLGLVIAAIAGIIVSMRLKKRSKIG